MTEHDATTKPPRRRKGRVLLGALLVAVLVCAGFWFVYTNWSGPTREPRPVDGPITVTAGDAFALGGFSYEVDWEIQSVGGTLLLPGLVATNRGEHQYDPDLEIALEQESDTVAVITCSGSPTKPGESTVMQCRSDQDAPSGYDRLVVSDGHTP